MDSSSEIFVSVESVEPPDAELELVHLAKDGICAGAMQVLGPLGKGARIMVTRLVINSVDFKQGRFTLYAARELARLVENAS